MVMISGKSDRSRQGMVHRAFFDFHSKEFVVINDFLVFVTLLTIFGFILESVRVLSAYQETFRLIETIGTVCFAAEYLARLVIAKRKMEYVMSFFGIIDFLAFAPSLFGLGNFTVLKSARMLRIFRSLRIIRVESDVAKQETRDIETFYRDHSGTLSLYFSLLFLSLSCFSFALYVIEGHTLQFASFEGIFAWLAGTLVGTETSYYVPNTVLAISVYVALQFAVLILFGFMLNIAAGFVGEWRQKRWGTSTR